MSHGVVREWHREDGWGVIDSPATPGGCWVLYSHIDMPPPAELQIGQQVAFSFEQVTSQDGYQWRAVVVRPEGVEPRDARDYITGPQGSFSSTLKIEFDEEGVDCRDDPRTARHDDRD
jgi:CspA family cold shock protein